MVDRAAWRLHQVRTPLRPVISAGPYGFEHVNAADQRRDVDSILNWTERIIRMRKEVPEIGWGDEAVLRERDPAILALRYDWRNNSIVVVHNLAQAARDRLRGRPGRRHVRVPRTSHRGPQPAGRGRRAPPRARRLRLPLVPRRRAGLPPEAERDLSGGPPREPLSRMGGPGFTHLGFALLLPSPRSAKPSGGEG